VGAGGGPQPGWWTAKVVPSAVPNRPQSRSLASLAELSEVEQQRLHCTHVMDECTNGLVHKQRWITTNFQMMTENKNKSGRLRYQSVSTVAAINDDAEGTGFNHGRIFQLREFKTNPFEPEFIDYTIILCRLLECRKLTSQGTFMRLGIGKNGASHAMGVVVPLRCIHTSMGVVFYNDPTIWPRTVGLHSLGCEVELRQLSLEDECFPEDGTVLPDADLCFCISELTSNGGPQLVAGTVPRTAFGGKHMKTVRIALHEMNIAQLRAELAARGFHTLGRKDELALRLREAVVLAGLDAAASKSPVPVTASGSAPARRRKGTKLPTALMPHLPSRKAGK
jgi:hypothetical protein